MKVIIIRHGSAFPVSKNFSEEDRPLTEKGYIETKKMGKYYSRFNIKFDEIWVSPYIRAIQTKDNIFFQEIYDKQIILDELKPKEKPEPILKLIKSGYNETKILGIIGHQPQIGRILSKMLNTSEHVFDIQPATSIEVDILKSSNNTFQFKLIRFLQAQHII